MGSSPTKPEFFSVLADKQVKEGGDVTLRCEANTQGVTAKWEKNGYRLECVEEKHVKRESGMFSLIIRNAAKEDEGKYTLSLRNKSGIVSCSAMVTVEFVSILADKQVKEGDDVNLRCEANTQGATAKWERNSYDLKCVKGKHVKRESGMFSLIIRNAAKEDEGKYTLSLSNDSGSVSCSAMVTVELREWRTVQWKQDSMITSLKNFKINNDNIRELRFLLHGPVGAGKSSTINTIKTIFDGHQFINCLAASDLSGESFTTKYQKYTAGAVPFAFYDLMGIEKDQLKGVQTDDIISALKGHIPDDYEFKPQAAMCEDNVYYIRNPTLNDQIHCLVSVIAADKVAIMDNKVIQKMKTIRAEASKLGIPQLVFMTRVDNVCMLTRENLAKIYQSKKIKEKMEECSTRLGVPMNCIFPLKNYHEETKQNEKLNCLVLEAFTQAVYSANDYVKKFSRKDKHVE